MFILLQCFRP